MKDKETLRQTLEDGVKKSTGVNTIPLMFITLLFTCLLPAILIIFLIISNVKNTTGSNIGLLY